MIIVRVIDEDGVRLELVAVSVDGLVSCAVDAELDLIEIVEVQRIMAIDLADRKVDVIAKQLLLAKQDRIFLHTNNGIPKRIIFKN